MLRVAYQGVPGAYSEEAIGVFWNGAAVAVPMHTFTDAVSAVADGQVEAAVIPVENSRTGIIEASREALLAHAELLALVETGISVRHQLLALPGASIAAVRRVASHAAAIAQCREWFARHPHVDPIVVSDTAGAAREVARANDYTMAAIASAAAGMRYGLSVLMRDLQDDPANCTRFWAVARRPIVAVSAGRGVRDLGGVSVRSALEALSEERDAKRHQPEAAGDAGGVAVHAPPRHGGMSHGLA